MYLQTVLLISTAVTHVISDTAVSASLGRVRNWDSVCKSVG